MVGGTEREKHRPRPSILTTYILCTYNCLKERPGMMWGGHPPTVLFSCCGGRSSGGGLRFWPLRSCQLLSAAFLPPAFPRIQKQQQFFFWQGKKITRPAVWPWCHFPLLGRVLVKASKSMAFAKLCSNYFQRIRIMLKHFLSIHWGYSKMLWTRMSCVNTFLRWV